MHSLPVPTNTSYSALKYTCTCTLFHSPTKHTPFLSRTDTTPVSFITLVFPLLPFPFHSHISPYTRFKRLPILDPEYSWAIYYFNGRKTGASMEIIENQIEQMSGSTSGIVNVRDAHQTRLWRWKNHNMWKRQSKNKSSSPPPAASDML